MVDLLTTLAAGSLALAPAADLLVAGGLNGAAPAAARPAKDCARRLDPSFVHFVAPAASATGNPLLRLVASPNLATGAAIANRASSLASCTMTPLLTRWDSRP
jgi:hypothetical protein